MSFIRELRKRNVIRVGIAYIAAAWIVIQGAETLFPVFGFDDTPTRVVVIVLAIGLVPTLIVSWVFELTPEGWKKEQDVDREKLTTSAAGRRLDFAIIGMLVVALSYFAFDKFYLDPDRDAAMAVRTVSGLAEVRDLMGENQFAEAYRLARQLDPSLADESIRQDLWAVASHTVEIATEPSGAEIWIRPYNSSEDDWEYLGMTPIAAARVPQGMSRLRIELEGYRTLNISSWAGWESLAGYGRTFRLDPVDVLPEDMVRVMGNQFEVSLPGLEHLDIELPDYFIDATEVTNREYQRFVDEGGYENPAYWQHKFVKDEHELSFEEAMSLFKDPTGRPGPSTWTVGRFPDGTEDHPVSGVSWYEAAAYAEFVGKQLPTVFHWYWAAFPRANEFFLPHSNFSDQGVAPVGTFDGISLSGAYDMAGNVREWVWNESVSGRFLLGGGWSDPDYMSVDANAQSSFDRDPLNGFRLMLPLDDTNLELARGRVDVKTRDYRVEQPVPDEIFDVYRRIYDYDRTPLNAHIVAQEQVEHWTRETIELDAAYGNERFTVYLFIPNDAKPPYTPVVHFPASGVIYLREFPAAEFNPFPFLTRSGFAVLIPVFKGTFDRGTELKSPIPNETNAYREHVIAWSKDLGRSVDYLDSRPDIAMDRLAYFGFSWGAGMAPVMLAMEPRFKTAVLLSGGLPMQTSQPEVDLFNFLPRVKTPTLMINVSTDYLFSLERSQEPFFELLGSEFKKHAVFEGGGGHMPPMNFVVRESLNWFDRHLPPAPDR